MKHSLCCDARNGCDIRERMHFDALLDAFASLITDNELMSTICYWTWSLPTMISYQLCTKRTEKRKLHNSYLLNYKIFIICEKCQKCREKRWTFFFTSPGTLCVFVKLETVFTTVWNSQTGETKLRIHDGSIWIEYTNQKH